MAKMILEFLRQTIGKLIPADPEKERVIGPLLERLKDHDKWTNINNVEVIHKEFNIKLTSLKIEKPDHVWIPFRWRSHIQEHINVIVRNDVVNRLNFVHGVVSGKYMYQVKLTSGCGYKEWLEENASSDDYFIYDYWIYFLSEETAMGFKLAKK